MKNNKYLVLLTSFMTVFLCVIIGLYSISGVVSVDQFDNTYIEKYFDKEKVMEVNLEISEEDLKDMDENAIKKEFKLGNITVNGDKYNNVGIRTKGNSSLTSVANSDSDRYSFKVSFDKYNDGQSMDGLTTLNLNNNYSDPSYMREYITYSISKDMGLATPEFAFAKVSINGNYHGLYLAIEEVGGNSYLENNFNDTTGEVYKADERASLVYQNDDSESYSSLVYKGDKKNNSWSNVTKLLKSLETGEDVEKYLDVDSVLKNIAINTALLNLDSYQGSFAHNYYLYEQNGVFTMLPWDFNMSFGGFSGAGGMPRNSEKDDKNNQDDDSQARKATNNENESNDSNDQESKDTNAQKSVQSIYIDEPTTGNMDERPLISTLFENSEYKEKYHEYLNEIVTNYLDSDYIENMTTKISKMIDQYVKEDPTAFYSYEDYKNNISTTVEGSGDNMGQKSTPGILEVASQMSETIKSQLSGELPSEKDEDAKDSSNEFTGDPEDFGKNGMDFSEDGNMPPIDGDNFPQNGDMPDMPANMGNQSEQNNNNESKSNNGNVDTKNNQNESDDQNSQQGDRKQLPEGAVQGKKGDFKMGENPNSSGNTKQNLIIVGISMIIMLIALLFTKLFKKRRMIS